ASYVADSQRAALVQDAVRARLDHWSARIGQTVGARLGYRGQDDGSTVGLLQIPGGDDWSLFACLTSLRDVEPTVNFVLDDGGLGGRTTHPWIFTERAPAPAHGDDTEEVL